MRFLHLAFHETIFVTSKWVSQINPFQPSFAFHIEISHLFCRGKQITGFYMNATLGWNRLIHFVLMFSFNPFVPNAPFLYLLKISENRKVFWCFQRVEKGYIGKKWVNSMIIRILQNKGQYEFEIGSVLTIN